MIHLRRFGFVSRYLKFLCGLIFLITGYSPCNRNRCKTCKHIKATDIFRSTVTGKSYTVTTPATCKIKGVVYLIECKWCQMQYVGMTTRALYKRFGEHRFDIRYNKMTSVAEHFNRYGHSMEDLTIMIIDQEHHVEILRKRERYWIYELRTKAPYGINRH